MNTTVEAPAVHPSGLRVFARPMHGHQLPGRKIVATTETAGRSAGTLTTGLDPSELPKPNGRIPGLMMPRVGSTGDIAVRMKTPLSATLVDDLLATWDGAVNPYEPGEFPGGMPRPQSYFPADPDRVPPPFPTLEEQSSWLSDEDVAFCRNYASEAGA